MRRLIAFLGRSGIIAASALAGGALYYLYCSSSTQSGSVKGVAKKKCEEGDGTRETQVVNMPVSADTRYIISTSGRPSSMRRYKVLLRDILKVNISYIPINAGGEESSSKKIDPQDFCFALRGLRGVGGAISKDIKGTVHAFLDNVDDLAKEIGSINTVICRGDALIGYNTDAYGFKIAIGQGIEQLAKQGKTVCKAVCYGYGGVCSVVVACLKSMGIEVYITGRSLATASKRAADLWVDVYDREKHGQCDLFVNAAPVTDEPLKNAVNFLPTLEGCSLVFDHELVGTELIKYCRANNVIHIPGKAMYWPQMAEQWKLFLQDMVDKAVLDNIMEHLQKAEQIANGSGLS